MNASHAWLKALVGFALTPSELRDLITGRCATVDEVHRVGPDLSAIVVARVAEAGRHPNSDHLSVTKVDAGSGTLIDVVCGAPNVRAGGVYPFAPVGTVMPNGLKIETRKIRGAVSNGMLCSARELGVGGDGDGLLDLDTAAAPGTPFAHIHTAGDWRLVVDVTPNRGDLLSHVGLAREIAAALALPFRLPPATDNPAPIPPALRAARESVAGRVTVRVDATEIVRRYMAVTVRGVRIGASPPWLIARLEAVGARSVNNVVDATNYVLHELGQPVHAFDASTLAGQAIVVRRAAAGETLATLDGTTRTLRPEMLVIADAERPQALAGVMGGKDSQVTDATTDLLLEVATFDAASTRTTRRGAGISTDASYRFERGVDPELAPVALERVAQLVIALAGGYVDGAPVDVYPSPVIAKVVTVRLSRVERLLGVAIPASEIGHLLASIAFGVDMGDGESLRVSVPSWRPDIGLEADVIEEIARLRGYDSFPEELRPQRPSRATDDAVWIQARRVRERLVALGLLEVIPMPFVGGAGGAGWVRVANPLSENEAFLRNDLLSTLARRAEYNLSHMTGDVRIFEIGTAFASGAGARPREEVRVAALVMGARRPPHFTERTPPAVDAWDARSLAEDLASVAYPGTSAVLTPGVERVLWQIAVDGESVGNVVSVALDAPVWAAGAYGIELRLAVTVTDPVAPPGVHRPVAQSPGPRVAVRDIRLPAPTPAVAIDLALVLPPAVTAGQVESVLRAACGDVLESVDVLDEYRGQGMAAGERSVLWRLTLRHPERTLSAKEVDGRRDRIRRTLEQELSVRLRTS
ncbi:MAG: phenylalanine--tRNA ligase subunit beta [Gemmatimonadaceae bacterium]